MQRNNGVAACASCRHQRKKCTEKCVLAPFFPVNKSQEFHAVHKVFGVSNVTKIVSSLNSHEDRKKAVDSLVWEAVCRQKDPVDGPYAEYKKVIDELVLYRRHCQQPQQNNNNHNLYKSGSSLIGWNGNKGITNNNNNNNGGLNVIGDCPYSTHYPSSLQKRQDRNNDSRSSLIHPQQLPLNTYNPPYYIPVDRYGYCVSKMDRHEGEQICGIEDSESTLLDLTQSQNHEGHYTPLDSTQGEKAIWHG